MGGSVRVGRSVGGSFSLGTVAVGGSKGVRGRKRLKTARELASGTVGIWEGIRVRDVSSKPLFVVFPSSGAAGALGVARFYFWFFPDSVGCGIGVGSLVKWLVALRVSALGGDNVDDI